MREKEVILKELAENSKLKNDADIDVATEDKLLIEVLTDIRDTMVELPYVMGDVRNSERRQ